MNIYVAILALCWLDHTCITGETEAIYTSAAQCEAAAIEIRDKFMETFAAQWIIKTGYPPPPVRVAVGCKAKAGA